MLGGITIVILICMHLHLFAVMHSSVWSNEPIATATYCHSITPLGPEQWISMALKQSAFAAVRLFRKKMLTLQEVKRLVFPFVFFAPVGWALYWNLTSNEAVDAGLLMWKVVARCWFELIFWCLNALMKLDVWWFWRPSETIVLLEWLHGTGW